MMQKGKPIKRVEKNSLQAKINELYFCKYPKREKIKKGFYKKLTKVLGVTKEALRLWRKQDWRFRSCFEMEKIQEFIEGKL